MAVVKSAPTFMPSLKPFIRSGTESFLPSRGMKPVCFFVLVRLGLCFGLEITRGLENVPLLTMVRERVESWA